VAREVDEIQSVGEEESEGVNLNKTHSRKENKQVAGAEEESFSFCVSWYKKK